MASIKKRGNSYRIFVSNGRDVNGKQIIETATFTPDPQKTERQNKKALDVFTIEFEQQVKAGKFLDGEKISFQAFADRYLEEYAMYHLDENTRSLYSSLLRLHINPAIGSLKLAKIQPRNLNNLYNQLLTERKDGRDGGYSTKTIRHVHTTISAVFAVAIRWNVVLDNPCDRVKPPKAISEEKLKYFTLEQAEAFLCALNAEYSFTVKGHYRTNDTGKSYYVDDYLEKKTIPAQYKLFFNLALFCGMRRGELIALEWSDFDFPKNTLSITKSTCIVDKKIITKKPKTKSSNRIISVPLSVMTLAREYRKEQLQLQLSLGTAWEGKNYVFIQWNGKQMYPSTPYAEFKKIIKWHNASVKKDSDKLPNIPLHGLRHTSATLLISQNVDLRTVSGRLGHAQTSTTTDIYSHFLKKADESAANSLENLFSFENKNKKTLTKC